MCFDRTCFAASSSNFVVAKLMGKRHDYIADFPFGGVPNSVAVFENVSSEYSFEMFPIIIRNKKMENEMT